MKRFATAQRGDLEEFLTLAVRERLYGNRGNLHFFMRSIFRGSLLEGARVLDVGGGTGLCSYYAAAVGATKAVCLEPEADGGTRTAHEGFKRLASLPFSERVELKCTTLQDYDEDSGGFDVVLLHNSINHLDESACMELHRSKSARSVYRGILSKVFQLTRDGGRLIVCDCARHNFFPDMGMRHPLCSNIEWHKHQSPQCWANLFSEVGFHSPCITWTSFNSLRGVGRVLLGNMITSYFLCSDFRIEMRRGSRS